MARLRPPRLRTDSFSFPIEPEQPLVVDHMSFAPQQHMEPPIAEPPSLMGNRFHPLAQRRTSSVLEAGSASSSGSSPALGTPAARLIQTRHGDGRRPLARQRALPLMGWSAPSSRRRMGRHQQEDDMSLRNMPATSRRVRNRYRQEHFPRRRPGWRRAHRSRRPTSGAIRCCGSLSVPSRPSSAWKPARGRNGWLASSKRMGHRVRIIPAQFVKPYVKSQQERHHRCRGDRRSGDPSDDALRRTQNGRIRSICRRCIGFATSSSAQGRV